MSAKILTISCVVSSLTLLSIFGLYKLYSSNGWFRRRRKPDNASSNTSASETSTQQNKRNVTDKRIPANATETKLSAKGAKPDSKGDCVRNPDVQEADELRMRALVDMLDTTDEAMLQKVLVTIGNAAAFTYNQNALREAGCLSKLSHLLMTYGMAAEMGTNAPCPHVVNGIANSINNLSMNQCNQEDLQGCIPALIDFAASKKSPESVQLASLQALTNLSVTSKYHLPYTQVIQQLYSLLDIGTSTLSLQALKILANLSYNEDMVPHLLAAKAPRLLVSMLTPECEPMHLLRWTTILANISTTVKDNNITSATLPCEYKAASPETMFSALFGVHNKAKLKSKVFLLSKHDNDEIKTQATRMYAVLQE